MQDRDLVDSSRYLSQLIGVWIHDGPGLFHEGVGRIAASWERTPRIGLAESVSQLPLFAISEERTQFLTPSAAIAAPELIAAGRTPHRMNRL